MNKFKKGDNVIVTTGKDKGKKGKILDVNQKKKQVVVEGVNIMKHFQKPTDKTQGGIIPLPAAIDWSKISQVSNAGKAVRVGFEIIKNKKVRKSKQTQEVFE